MAETKRQENVHPLIENRSNAGQTRMDHVLKDRGESGNIALDFSGQWHFPSKVGAVGSTIGGLLLEIAFFSPLASVFRGSAIQSSTNQTERSDWDQTFA